MVLLLVVAGACWQGNSRAFLRPADEHARKFTISDKKAAAKPVVETSADAPTSATAADPQPADAKEGRGKPAGEKPAGSEPAGSKPAAKQAGPFAVPEGGRRNWSPS